MKMFQYKRICTSGGEEHIEWVATDHSPTNWVSQGVRTRSPQTVSSHINFGHLLFITRADICAHLVKHVHNLKP